MAMSSLISIHTLGFPWKTQDPFLFCAYHHDEYPSGDSNMCIDSVHLGGRRIGHDFMPRDGWRMYHGERIPGFPYHPHRGFETITINKQGAIDHSDSMGAAGRFMAGDVQWMTAGSGVQHSEMFPMLNEEKGNPLELFQIWLNLPKASKMVDPHFKMLWREDIPKVEDADEKGLKTKVDVVAGTLKGSTALPPTPNSWAANPANAVAVYTVEMQAGASWILPATAPGANRSIFFYKGDSITIEDEVVKVDKLVLAKAEEDITFVNGEADAYLLILEGKPINEPVVQHGPFVMNSEAEIRETMVEYGKTQFGGWPWERREVVHDRSKGRFALHADGTEETPG